MTQPELTASEVAFEHALLLGNEGERLVQLGKYQEAVPILKESMRLHRSIGVEHPSAVALAATLNNLGLCLGRLHQHTLAVGVLGEARQLCEPLWKAASEIEDLRLLMVRILGALSHSHAVLGEFQAALPVTELLVQLERSLLTPDEAVLDFDLAKDLRLFALVRARVGVDGHHANAAISESLLIFQALVRENAGRYARELVTTYDVFVEVLEMLGRQQDAAVVRNHVVEQYEALAQAMDQAGRQEEATAIRNYAAGLAAKSQLPAQDGGS